MKRKLSAIASATGFLVLILSLTVALGQEVISNDLVIGESGPLTLNDEAPDHCGNSVQVIVVSLGELPTELKRLSDAGYCIDAENLTVLPTERIVIMFDESDHVGEPVSLK
jgi:hypothetical protein